MTITNGTIKYGQTVKTGDYENKRADVELSFTVPEGEDAQGHIEHAHELAKHHCHRILGQASNSPASNPTAAAPVKIEAVAPVAKPTPVARGKSKLAATKASAEAIDARTESQEEAQPAILQKDTSKEKEESSLDDLLGLNEAPTEITDKALNDAVQKQQDAVKNAPGIRKLLNEFGIKTPPGRLIDLEQSKRADFIAKLQLIKALA